MADNYLERKYEEYEQKKALFLKRKKLGLIKKSSTPSDQKKIEQPREK
jgi:hypothetical protein